MNYLTYNQALIIFLFIILALGFGVAGELKIYSSEGVQTLSFPDSESSRVAQEQKRREGNGYNNYRRVSEKCIRGCDEEEVTPKDSSNLLEQNYIGGTENTIPEMVPPERVSSEGSAAEKTFIVRPLRERSSVEKAPAVTLPPEITYRETISQWKSYQDLANWMENEFSADRERNEKYEATLPVPRTAEETFQLKSGIDIDAAFFLKETLNQINPSYDARIVVLLIRPNIFNRYVCSFKAEGKLYIMDYGTLNLEVTGVHGPYSLLEEYKKFYEEYHPIKKKIEAITYLP